MRGGKNGLAPQRGCGIRAGQVHHLLWLKGQKVSLLTGLGLRDLQLAVTIWLANRLVSTSGSTMQFRCHPFLCH